MVVEVDELSVFEVGVELMERLEVFEISRERA